MPDPETLLVKLKQHPTDVRFETLKRLLEYHEYRLTHKKGSHFRFKKQGVPGLTIVSHHNTVKKWYVKDVLKQLGY